MWLGCYAQGDWVRIAVRCRTTAVVAPTAAPTVSIYGTSDTPILDAGGMAPSLVGTVTGVFERWVRLGSGYPAGRYTVRTSWASGGNSYAVLQCFDVMAGDAAGGVTGLTFYSRPHRDYLVLARDNGTLAARTNPGV